MRRALEGFSIASGQRVVHIIQGARIFIQEERGDFLKQIEIAADSSQRHSAIQDLVLQLAAHLYKNLSAVQRNAMISSGGGREETTGFFAGLAPVRLGPP